MAPLQASARRGGGSQWVLVGVAGLAALAGLMVAGTNTYLASEPYYGQPAHSLSADPPSLARAMAEGKAPVPTVTLTPEVVRALLTMDEKDQLSLVIDPKTDEERARQREVTADTHGSALAQRRGAGCLAACPHLARLRGLAAPQGARLRSPACGAGLLEGRHALTCTLCNVQIIDKLVLNKHAEAPLTMRTEIGLAEEGIEDVETEHHHHREVHHLLEEGGGAHELTPSQERAERLWALIFVTFIVTASVIFETCKEVILHNTPETMTSVVDKFFGELATLGFIGTLAFVFTTGIAGNASLLGHLSFWYLGDEELLIHEFEIVHFLIFFVMVFFVSAVLVILQVCVSLLSLSLSLSLSLIILQVCASWQAAFAIRIAYFQACVSVESPMHTLSTLTHTCRCMVAGLFCHTHRALSRMVAGLFCHTHRVS